MLLESVWQHLSAGQLLVIKCWKPANTLGGVVRGTKTWFWRAPRSPPAPSQPHVHTLYARLIKYTKGFIHALFLRIEHVAILSNKRN